MKRFLFIYILSIICSWNQLYKILLYYKEILHTYNIITTFVTHLQVCICATWTCNMKEKQIFTPFSKPAALMIIFCNEWFTCNDSFYLGYAYPVILYLLMIKRILARRISYTLSYAFILLTLRFTSPFSY